MNHFISAITVQEIIPHPTLHGILLSNTTREVEDCADFVVQKWHSQKYDKLNSSNIAPFLLLFPINVNVQ